jgi:hypothetical protein
MRRHKKEKYKTADAEMKREKAVKRIVGMKLNGDG